MKGKKQKQKESLSTKIAIEILAVFGALIWLFGSGLLRLAKFLKHFKDEKRENYGKV